MAGTIVFVDRLPKCDICDREAQYDAKTKQGLWGYLCTVCFKEHGVGLGTGKGQTLVQR